MIIYDDIASHEKIKIYDARVETPPHYDSFAEFQYSYHYGDMYVPYVKQEEPLKVECQHFVDCIREGRTPLTSGEKGMGVVRILEMASQSLKQNRNGHVHHENGHKPGENGSLLAKPRVVAPVPLEVPVRVNA